MITTVLEAQCDYLGSRTGTKVTCIFPRVEKRIRLVCRRSGDAVVVAVRDRGPGVPAEHLTKIFERLAVRFQREFEQVVSRVTPAEPPLSCTARAGQLEG